MPSEITRFSRRSICRGEDKSAPDGAWVRYTDHVAALASLPDRTGEPVAEELIDRAVDAYHAAAGKTGDWDGITAAVEVALAAPPDAEQARLRERVDVRQYVAEVESGQRAGFLNKGENPHGNGSDLDCPYCGGSGHKDDAEARLAQQVERATAVTEALPQDVAELVIAARIVAFEDQSPEALKRLDTASEAFVDRVPWDDELNSEASQ